MRDPLSARSVRGVLLDVDGTLIDSNDAHAAAYTDALEEAGMRVPFSRVRPLIGMGSEKLLPALGVEPHSRAAEIVTRRKKEIFNLSYLPELHAFPAARDLLDHMKKLGLKLVVATSASKEDLANLLRAGHLADAIDQESDSNDAAASKPDPDIVEAAIARSSLSREELVMIGDTPYDVEAAGRAGVRTVAFRSGGWSDGDLAGAAEIYDGPAQLLAGFSRSILSARDTRH